MLAVSDPGDAEGPGDSLCSAEDAVDRLSCDRRLTSERRAVGDRMPEKRDESLSSRAAAGALSSGVRGYAAVPVARLSRFDRPVRELMRGTRSPLVDAWSSASSAVREWWIAGAAFPCGQSARSDDAGCAAFSRKSGSDARQRTSLDAGDAVLLLWGGSVTSVRICSGTATGFVQ